YQALCRQIAAGTGRMFPQTEMLDLVIVKGQAKGLLTRSLRSGKIDRLPADAVVLATGGYGNVFYLSTNARGCNVTATYRAYKRGALFANPSFTQIHPTCIPVTGEHQSKLTLMSESLRNDGRVWVPKKKGDTRPPDQIPDEERDYYLERKYPSFGNLVPRDVASRNAKQVCDEERGVGESALMQGLADGYFVVPYTIGQYLASATLPKATTDHDAFKEAADTVQKNINRLLSIKGKRGIREIHRELGRIMWDYVGMSRNEPGLRIALEQIPKLRDEFWHDVSVPGTPDNLNQSLEYAGRV